MDVHVGKNAYLTSYIKIYSSWNVLNVKDKSLEKKTGDYVYDLE